jgi:hydrogenase/urease accessory protein HupE
MKWSSSALVCVVIAVAIAVCPSHAEAHSPIKGFGTFYSHVLHPFAVPSHALLLTAAALMLGQHGRSPARNGFVALGLSFVVGLTAAKAEVVGDVREPLLLCGAFVIGCMVVLGRQIPALLSTLVAAGAGIAIGVDSATDTLGYRDGSLAFVGVAIGVLYLVMLVTGFTLKLTKFSHRIGVRIAGSWIVAASLLVLAVSVNPLKQVTVGNRLVCEQTSTC